MLNGKGECKAIAKYEITNETGGQCKVTCKTHMKMSLKKYTNPMLGCVFRISGNIITPIPNPLVPTTPTPTPLINIEHQSASAPKYIELNRVLSIDVNDKECSICYEEMTCENANTVPSCKHTFHRKCINRWCIEVNHQHCPLCRNPIMVYNGTHNNGTHNV
jgi:hypothetical protein